MFREWTLLLWLNIFAYLLTLSLTCMYCETLAQKRAGSKPTSQKVGTEGRNVLKKCLVHSSFCTLMSCFAQVLKKPWSIYLTLQLKFALCSCIAVSHFLASVFQHFSIVHNIIVGRWLLYSLSLGKWGNLWPLELWWKPWLLCLSRRGAGRSIVISYCMVGWLQCIVCPLN